MVQVWQVSDLKLHACTCLRLEAAQSWKQAAQHLRVNKRAVAKSKLYAQGGGHQAMS